MSTRGTIKLATRGSHLALQQANVIANALEEHRYSVELIEVETTGDQLRDELIHRLGKTGAFSRAVDEVVLDGDADIAVHSMKDLPTEAPDELIVVGIPERGDPADMLVTPDPKTVEELADGARIGTASLRRTAQLLAVRPDLDVQPLRGNVDTRVEKLLAPHRQAEHEARLSAEEMDAESADNGEADEGIETYDRSVDEWFADLSEIERRSLERQVETPFDGIVLAAAGLERSHLLDQIETYRLPVRKFVPAPGQGAIAVTGLDGSEAGELIHDAVDDPRTRVETTVERAILAKLGGGCIAPIGIHAVIQGERVHTTVQTFSRDGTEVVEAARDLPIRTYLEAAESFAEDLKSRGAADLIDRARTDTADREPPRCEE